MLLLLSCVYEPAVVGSADYPETVTLSGDVVLYNGAPAGVAPVGHVLVYAADDLPPPAGFGSPIDLATISPDAWGTAGTGGVEGVVSAPWSITGLPDGDYVLTALIDNDNDFTSAVGRTEQKNLGSRKPCGDRDEVLRQIHDDRFRSGRRRGPSRKHRQKQGSAPNQCPPPSAKMKRSSGVISKS